MIAMAATGTVHDIVDTTRYPLVPDSVGWRAAVEAARADLAEDGCTVLRGFIRPELRERLREQGERMAPDAYYQVERVNAYNIPLDADLPDDHPGRIVLERGNAFVPRDRIPADTLIHRLYTSELCRRFVAECFGLAELHEFADPLDEIEVLPEDLDGSPE